MPKRKKPVMETPAARDIFNELDLYAKDKQFYPVPGALYSYMAESQFNYTTKKWEEPRYPVLARHIFYYWFNRLVEEHYIETDRATGAIRCNHLIIVEKDDVLFP